MKVDPSVPIQKLLFFVTPNITRNTRTRVYDLVTNIAASRKWVIGPPKFVDMVEYSKNEESGVNAAPAETIGGVLEIYSAFPPTVLPREIDLQHLDEVSALIDAVCAFSREQGASFEFELDQDCVGSVGNGEMGNGLADGLLGEWRSYLGLPAEGRIVPDEQNS